MKKTMHTEEKIIAAVKQLEAGRSAKEVAPDQTVLEVNRSTYRYLPRPDHNGSLRQALLAVARQKPR